MHNASMTGATANMVWCSKQQRFITTTSASDSEFAARFVIGCQARMGERVNRDAVISIRQMLALQTLFQREYEEAMNEGDLLKQRRICKIVVFFLICYCCSMRGFEAPKIMLHTLRGKIQLADSEDAPAHLAIPLSGRFKARSQEVSNLFLYMAA
jgi:hypothetical protein